MEIYDGRNNRGEDYALCGVGADGYVRILAAETTNLVAQASDIHRASDVATAALGRALTATVLFAKQLKNKKDSVTIQIKGRGPLGDIVTVANFGGDVKGYVVNPDVELPLNSVGKIDVGGGVGRGYMNVIKNMGMKEPYVGYSELVSGEIAEDISYYLSQSEQVPSVVALGVRLVPYEGDKSEGKPFTVDRAGGYILQLMPGASEELISKLEEVVVNMPSVTTLLSAGATMENIIEDIFKPLGRFFVTKSECRYHCSCSRERTENALRLLGKDELSAMIEEGNGAELKCDFCKKTYNFTNEDLVEIRKTAKDSGVKFK